MPPERPDQLRFPAGEFVRPLLRGRLHQLAFVASIPAGIALVLAAGSVRARVAALVYAATLTGLYGASSAYHRLARSTRAREILRRLDHSMIFLLIAGSYTPLGLVALHGTWPTAILAGVWLGAAGGIAVKVFRFHQWRKIGAALYMVLGWMVVLVFPEVVRDLPGSSLALLIAGGLLYTVGAIILALRRPDPVPHVFGYHEIWHALVVAAGVCHYVMILSLVRPA